MKRLMLILALYLQTAKTEAQKCKVKDVPAAVQNAFSTAYPGIKKTYWGKDSGNYHVAFCDGLSPVSVTYNTSGKRIITEMQIPAEDLPQNIMQYLRQHYPSEIFVDVAKLTDSLETETYEVQVKDLSLVFDVSGKLLQTLKCYD